MTAERFVVLGQRLHGLFLQLINHGGQVDELLLNLEQLQIEFLASHVLAPSRARAGDRAHYSILWARCETVLNYSELIVH